MFLIFLYGPYIQAASLSDEKGQLGEEGIQNILFSPLIIKEGQGW